MKKGELIGIPKLDKYKKKETLVEPVRTSVILEQTQLDWISQNEINLSKLVRDLIEELKETEKKKSK